MAVKSLMKSSGWTALAVGIAAMALPAAASAQTMSKSEFLQQRQAARAEQREARQEQSQVRQEQPAQSNAGNWQGRGNGETRGNGGNWQGRGDGGSRSGSWTPGRPQAQPQTAPQQVQRTWNGGDRGAWRQNNNNDQTTQQRWNNTDRVTQNRTWDGNRDGRRYDGNRDGRRWDGNRDGRRWDGNRDSNRYSWNNNWRRDNRYNWYNYRNSNRNVFRMGRYYSPYSNWSYRRLNIGFFLQPLFYSSSYWIDDPWQYRLPEAYGPYRWVRYYDDALLVDVYTGEVVDVIYDFFW